MRFASPLFFGVLVALVEFSLSGAAAMEVSGAGTGYVTSQLQHDVQPRCCDQCQVVICSQCYEELTSRKQVQELKCPKCNYVSWCPRPFSSAQELIVSIERDYLNNLSVVEKASERAKGNLLHHAEGFCKFECPICCEKKLVFSFDPDPRLDEIPNYETEWSGADF